MQPFVKLGKTLKRHMDGILGYFSHSTTSAAIEAVNGLLQLARRRARGYRAFRNFQAMAYWICGWSNHRIPTHINPAIPKVAEISQNFIPSDINNP
jgi:hypothetical protein